MIRELQVEAIAALDHHLDHLPVCETTTVETPSILIVTSDVVVTNVATTEKDRSHLHEVAASPLPTTATVDLLQETVVVLEAVLEVETASLR